MIKFPTKKNRNSNLELYRIIIMLLIVAHHSVVHSELFYVLGQEPLSGKSLFYYWFGMWGKTGINCFVLITGYFMCKSKITLQKFIKLLIEIDFYKLVIYLFFIFLGGKTLSLKELINVLLPTKISTEFSSCFLFFYLFIPFLNVLITNINKSMHLKLLLLSLTVYTLYGTLPTFYVRMNYISWFCVIYIFASYIRLYGFNKISHKGWAFLTLISILISMLSVVTSMYLSKTYGYSLKPYRWVQDSNTILAVLVAVCSFMYFKDIQIKYNAFINIIGSCTFGVLLIHDNLHVRHWLWNDVLKNVEMYYTDTYIIYSFLSVISVFLICVIIDYIRQLLVEKRLMQYVNRLWQKYTN